MKDKVTTSSTHVPLRRVAIDARMIGHSGIGTSIRGLLRGWAENPPPFELMLLGREERIRQVVPDGLEVDIAKFDAPIYNPATAMTSPPLNGADVFFCPHYAAPLRLGGVPLVAMIHDLIHITHPTRVGTAPFMRAWLAALRRRARFIVTPSRHTKVQLQTLHRFAAHRVLTIAEGPGVVGFKDDVPLPPELAALGPYLLAVGIDKPHKQWDFLLERLAFLWRHKQITIPLVAAGLNAAGRERIPALASRLGCGQHVTLAPHLPDAQMASLYRGARALLFPSLIEGFGLPLLEAMTAGTPVVAADLPPMNEIGGNALITFDHEFAESFDTAVLHAMTDGAARETAIARGLERAREYSWKKFASKMTEVFVRANAGE